VAVEQARFENLGQSVVDLVPNDAGKILLYVEFDDGVIGPSLFYKLDGDLRYVEDVDSLFDELQVLQDLFGPEVRVMEFELEGSKFITAFTYDEEFDDSADTLSRRALVLKRHFGHSEVKV
jgi:hypothetical protein